MAVASCHVVDFDPGAALQYRRSASIEIRVGGGLGDLSIMVRTSNPKACCTGFRHELTSPARRRWDGISQGGCQFNAVKDVPFFPLRRISMTCTT